jgi:transcriptional regulator GlxA family with amidase domain
MVTEADGIYCGAGMYACLDLSLYLVERFCGRQIALQTARAFLIEPPRTWQSGFAAVAQGAQHGDSAVAEAQTWIHDHFAQPVRFDDLCAQIGMSPRNFARRFRAATGDTPLGYLHKLRMDSARSLLESESRTVQEVSVTVGYDDVAFFRRLFRRHTGVSPQEYRRRFGTKVSPGARPGVPNELP